MGQWLLQLDKSLETVDHINLFECSTFKAIENSHAASRRRMFISLFSVFVSRKESIKILTFLGFSYLLVEFLIIKLKKKRQLGTFPSIFSNLFPYQINRENPRKTPISIFFHLHFSHKH